MRIRVVAQNLDYGALRDGDGNPEDRWPQLAARINAVRPDILLLNEVVGWDAHQHKQLGRAMNDLDLDAVPLPPSTSGYRSAILYRAATLGRWQRAGGDDAKKTTHGFVIASFEVGLPMPLTVAAAHLDPETGDKAIVEAKAVATRAYRFGPFAVLGGDMNFAPEDGPLPDFSEMRPYNVAARTLLEDPADIDAQRRPDRRSAWMLRKCGYLDVAWELFQATGDEQLLQRTASDDRLDRIHVAQAFGKAISNYQRLDWPAGASPHDGVAVDIDTDAADRSNLWTYR